MRTRTVVFLLLYALLLMYMGIIIWVAPFQISIPLHLIAILLLGIIAVSNYILQRMAVTFLFTSITFAMLVSLIKNLLS